MTYTIVSKSMKYLKNKSNKRYIRLFWKKYIIILKDIEDLNKLRNSKIRRFKVIKLSILPKLIYKLNAIPVKIPEEFFMKIYKLIITFKCATC